MGLTPEQGVRLWQILQGEVKPTEKEERSVEKIEFKNGHLGLYLNWRNPTTPLSYIVERKDTLRAMYSGSKDGQMLERLLMRAGETD